MSFRDKNPSPIHAKLRGGDPASESEQMCLNVCTVTRALVQISPFCAKRVNRRQDIALKFCMLVVCTYLDHICSGFLKICPVFENISGNQNFGLKNIKILKFYDCGNFEIAAFFVRLFYVYDPILESLGC